VIVERRENSLLIMSNEPRLFVDLSYPVSCFWKISEHFTLLYIHYEGNFRNFTIPFFRSSQLSFQLSVKVDLINALL
jgi:hypothetical protein